jgi:hypothetical protein
MTSPRGQNEAHRTFEERVLMTAVFAVLIGAIGLIVGWFVSGNQDKAA